MSAMICSSRFQVGLGISDSPALLKIRVDVRTGSHYNYLLILRGSRRVIIEGVNIITASTWQLNIRATSRRRMPLAVTLITLDFSALFCPLARPIANLQLASW